jgi:hypothetical protein
MSYHYEDEYGDDGNYGNVKYDEYDAYLDYAEPDHCEYKDSDTLPQ